MSLHPHLPIARLCHSHTTMETSFIFAILLAFSTIFASADIDWSIDCGSSDYVYTDENSMIWSGDDDKISSGKSQVVPDSNSVKHVLSTLRVFTSKKKNCYSLLGSKGEQVYIRATFYYGNYDEKSSPPTFDLQFDGNHWTTVVTELDQAIYYETTYVTKFDYISVCLAQTGQDQFPFISTLEVRSLGANMYKHVDANYPLFLLSRIGYGISGVVRYDDDAYDRMWNPASIGSALQVVNSDAVVDTSVDDNPPSAVMQNAVTATNTSTSIVLSTDLPSSPIPIYMNLYFAELTQLDTTQKRSFQLYIDDKPDSDFSAIIPTYQSVKELIISNMSASSSTSFSLVATSDSTLPPLINALELFHIGDPLTDGTYSKDVEGLIGLQNQFTSLQEWSSDPCLPSPYSWEWVNCTSDPTPLVTALYLSGYNLSGELPDFSSMTALVKIDLHNNSLTGEIPDFLGSLPNLKELNLADNSFVGAIPSSITSNKNIKLTVTGNPNLCTSAKNCKTSSTSAGSSDGTNPSGSKKKSKLPVILGAVIPVFIVFWIIVGAVVIMQQRRKRAAIDALTAGQPSGGGAAPMLNNQQTTGMVEKIAQVAMHEVIVNVQEQMRNENSQTDGENQNNPTYNN